MYDRWSCLLKYRIFPHLHFSWRSSVLYDQFFNCKQNESERAVRRQQAAGNHSSGKGLVGCLQQQRQVLPSPCRCSHSLQQSWTEGPHSCSRRRWVTIIIPIVLGKKKVEPYPKISHKCFIHPLIMYHVHMWFVSLSCLCLLREATCEGITVLCLELAEIISKDYFWDKKSWRGTFDQGIQW